MRNATKNPIIETDIFVGDNSNVDDIKEDIKEEDKENQDLLITNSYCHTITMTYMH